MTDAVIESNAQIAPRSPKRSKWIAAGVAVVVVLGGVFVALANRSPVGVAIPLADTYTVRTLPQAANIATTGTVAADSEVNVAFQNVSGTIQTLNVQVGDHVQAGQVLATLNNAVLQAQVEQAQAGVAQAEGALGQAQAQYRIVTQGATAQNIAVAQAGVNSAKTALANAQKQYQVAEQAYNDRTAQQEQLTAAQNGVAQAQTAYETAQQNQQTAIVAAESALATAQNNLAVDQQNLTTDQQQYGTITLAQVQKEYTAYQNALDSYNAWQNGAYAGINPYAANLQATQTVYQSDSTGYYARQGTQQKVQGDETALSSAKNQLTQAQSAVSQAKTAYDNAQSAEKVAEQAYNDRTAQQQQLTAAANAVKQTQAAVGQAESQLAQVQQPATSAQVNAAESAIQTATAGVQAAKAQLHTAQVNEGYAVLRASVSGTITQKINSVGDFVGPGQPILAMDVAQLQIELAVSDTQLPFVKIGTPITTTVTALPGQTFTGKVFEVDPTPIPGNGLEYRVKATLNDKANVLKPGMSGNVVLATGANSGAELAIPAMALQQVNGVYGVYVLGDKSGAANANANLPSGVYFQPVQIGYQGSRYVEVTSGLKNGEEILLGVGRFIPN